MIRKNLYLMAASALAIAVLPALNAVEPPAQAAGQRRAAAKPRDLTKEAIEGPSKAVLRNSSGTAPTEADANPKVEPGKVRWHADFATACAAAQKSGKPVLLFQMMGRLDQQFC